MKSCAICATPGAALCAPCRASGWGHRGHGEGRYWMRHKTVMASGRTGPFSGCELRYIARILGPATGPGWDGQE